MFQELFQVTIGAFGKAKVILSGSGNFLVHIPIPLDYIPCSISVQAAKITYIFEWR